MPKTTRRPPSRERNLTTATSSGYEPKVAYTPEDTAGLKYGTDLGDPGHYPYTRGVRATMYRGRLWTMRQFSGFATPEETNLRYHFLLEKGQTGLSVAFDLPTLMGRDSDDAYALGEVGRCGVAVDTLKDVETIFRGINLGEVSVSMTINGPAAILMAMYFAVADEQGVPRTALRGTCQNDILKEYMAQKEWLFPVEPSMRLIVDTVEYCFRETPQYNPISISGYHIREAGANALQEMAFTLANGLAYVRACVDRGMPVDEFAPRLSFFWDCHNDFFEEIAKFRAARRVWARRMKDQFGAKKPESMLLRFHTQTAGVTLTAQQPENNIVRVAYQAMAAALGGTQSLHTNSMDETLALPTEKAAHIALRTQQVLAYETGVANTVDPLAGSYYVEALTDWMDRECEAYFARIEAQGGVVAGIKNGWFQKEIGRSAFEHQREVEARRRIIVGVNDFVEPEAEVPIPVLKINKSVEQGKVAALRVLKAARDPVAVAATLARVRAAAAGHDNVMPALIDAVKAYCTLGEIVETMRGVYGTWREPVVF